MKKYTKTSFKEVHLLQYLIKDKRNPNCLGRMWQTYATAATKNLNLGCDSSLYVEIYSV